MYSQLRGDNKRGFLSHLHTNIGLSNELHVTIRFETKFKSISRGEAGQACKDRLRKMDIALNTKYSNPIDIGLNFISKNLADFIILHLHQPHKDGCELFKGEQTFVMAWKTA